MKQPTYWCAFDADGEPLAWTISESKTGSELLSRMNECEADGLTLRRVRIVEVEKEEPPMTTPPPDALEQIKRLEASGKLMKQIELYHNGIDLLSWLLPLARAQLEGWRPIETNPPPHATDVLLWSPDGTIEARAFSSGKRGDGWSSYSEHAFATHWQPLPSPPQKDECDVQAR